MKRTSLPRATGVLLSTVLTIIASAAALQASDEPLVYSDFRTGFQLTFPAGWEEQSGGEPGQTLFAKSGRVLILLRGQQRWGLEGAIERTEYVLGESARRINRLSTKLESHGGYPVRMNTYRGSGFRNLPRNDDREFTIFAGAMELPQTSIVIYATVSDPIQIGELEGILASVRPAARPKKAKKSKKTKR